MQREIKLNGGEISFLKALGLSGAPIAGKMLFDKCGMETAEFLDTLDGLLTQDYVLSSKVNVQKMEDVERSYFRANPSYSRDLRDALRPGQRRDKDRTRRRRG
ncbi:MAG: hypothetical protein QOI34_1773 [Verrucomicrobiota bacterium]